MPDGSSRTTKSVGCISPSTVVNIYIYIYVIAFAEQERAESDPVSRIVIDPEVG